MSPRRRLTRLWVREAKRSQAIECRALPSSPRQNVAIGLSGDPVPPRIGNGAAVSRNSHRLRDAAASASARDRSCRTDGRPDTRARNRARRPRRTRCARRDVLRMIASEQRDVSRLEPRQHRRMKPGGLPAVRASAQPGPDGLASRPHAGPHEQRVASRHLHARLLLPRLEILDVDRRAGLQIRHALQARDIDQNSAREDAVLDVVNRVLRVADP